MPNITFESPPLVRLMRLFNKDKYFIEEIVNMFLEEAPKAIHDLGNGLQSHNVIKTEKAITDLESICADFETEELKKTLNEIHDEVEAGKYDLACTSFKILKSEFNHLKDEITQ